MSTRNNKNSTTKAHAFVYLKTQRGHQSLIRTVLDRKRKSFICQNKRMIQFKSLFANIKNDWSKYFKQKQFIWTSLIWQISSETPPNLPLFGASSNIKCLRPDVRLTSRHPEHDQHTTAVATVPTATPSPSVLPLHLWSQLTAAGQPGCHLYNLRAQQTVVSLTEL